MITRRAFVVSTASGAATAAMGWKPAIDRAQISSATGNVPAYSIIPVVGDGKFIWTKPPENETGYLEPRPYEVEIGIDVEGVGGDTPFMATTPSPIEHPEQRIDEVQVETAGNCEAKLRKLRGAVGQLFVRGRLAQGQRARAVARYRMTLFKQYHGYNRDQFPAEQETPKKIRDAALQNSPGIETRAPSVRKLASRLSGGAKHPWDKAQRFAQWVQENIRPQIGAYTNVVSALKNRIGDCEEMAAVLVALCRSVGIPARLVWVPNHNWAEIYLVDHYEAGHWIPVHTSCYSWFGWTGAHELVLQKGDRITVPELHGQQRLLSDWARYTGRKPNLRYIGNLKPLPPSEGADPGPGARSKNKLGDWRRVGDHELDRYLRR